MRYIKPFLFLILIFCSLNSIIAGEKDFHVMAPLHVQIYNNPLVEEDKDWQDFRKQLGIVKRFGVTAVTVDVWWGLVEGKADNTFDWSYYKKILGEIKNAGLKWTPIIAFHRCGGNVGDNYTQPIPGWVWGTLKEKHDEIESELDLKYLSEAKDEAIGNTGSRKFSNETVALWADEYVIPQYIEFMEAFENEFGEFSSITHEINISLGPSGELRYPSYNSHDWGGYPNRGTLQCYSRPAMEDFRKYIKAKYGTIEKVNESWNTGLRDFSEIRPPGNPGHFFTAGDYKNIPYGLDFTGWYHRSLVLHGRRMLEAAAGVFNDGPFSRVKIGFKIPGVHWQMMNPTMPRVAEITAGLIDSRDNHLRYGKGYEAALAKIVTTGMKKKITLHFTCLEMGNEYSGTGPSPTYSRAEDLVFWIGAAAHHQDIEIKGENALDFKLNNDYNWDKIENVFKYSYYTGITILRIINVSGGKGKERYSRLIAAYN